MAEGAWVDAWLANISSAVLVSPVGTGCQAAAAVEISRRVASSAGGTIAGLAGATR